jgi:NADH-quinone oxidoreductase subunit H
MGRHTHAIARALLLLAMLVGGPSCAPGRSPELLEVDEVTPHAIERGTHVELGGTGFPDRRVAQVAFVGLVHRPGEPPRPVTVRTTADADSRSHLRLTVGGDLLAQFLDGAPHATFRGSVVVGFGARSQDAPALSGKLDGVVIDLFGDRAARHGAEASLREQGAAFSEFLGLRLSESFEVTEVRPGSEGQHAGLLAGDRVVALDGVRVDTLADLAPRPDGRQSELTMRRPGLGEFVRPLDKGGFRPARLADLAKSAALVLAALALLLLVVGRRGRSWAFLEARLAERMESTRSARNLLSRLTSLSSGVDLASKLPATLRWLPYAGFFGVSAALSAMALGRSLIGVSADLALLISVACAATWIAAFVQGGREPAASKRRGRQKNGFRLGRGLVRAAQAFGLFLPVLLGLSSAVYEDGTLGLSELVAKQGGWPTEWRALQSPWTLLALLLVLFVWVPTRDELARGVVVARSKDAAAEISTADALARLLDGLALVLTCALAAAVFLGGWAVPSWLTREASGSSLPSLVGAGLYLAKTWLLLHAVLWWRHLLAANRSEVWGTWLRWSLPLSAGSFALHVGAASFGWFAAEKEALALSTQALLCVVLAFGMLRAVHVARGRLPNTAINPWL